MNEYEKQAQDFLDKTGATIECQYIGNHLYFDCDTQKRNIYAVTITRGSRKMTFKYGQSIINSAHIRPRNKKLDRIETVDCPPGITPTYIHYRESDLYGKGYGQDDILYVKGSAPSNYDILASSPSMYGLDSFEAFCHEYGYDTDSRRAYRTYEEVSKQATDYKLLFSDEELEELADII